MPRRGPHSPASRRNTRRVRAKRRRTSRTRTRRRAPRFRATRAAAQRRLRKFRQGSALAVAATGLFLVLFGIQDAPAQEDTVVTVDTAFIADSAAAADTTPANPAQSVEEATGTLRQLANDFMDVLPKVLIALAVIGLAAILARVSRAVLYRVLGRWEKAAAVSAMAGVLIWLLAIGVGLSVITGDSRALVGSVGLIGLALSWALQAPIESFAGWIVNSFKGYYRVGDRIEVGDVFGDVYRIDALTTTVWEAGGPDKPVHGAQPTGALITFPNSEVLRANIVNFTRGFPYVWDEVTMGITNESDLSYAVQLAKRVADDVVGPMMADPIGAYRRLLEKRRLAFDVSEKPQVYLAPAEAWTDLTVRYLVPVRERRKWSSELYEKLSAEFNKPEHAGRVQTGYPVRRVYMDE